MNFDNEHFEKSCLQIDATNVGRGYMQGLVAQRREWRVQVNNLEFVILTDILMTKMNCNKSPIYVHLLKSKRCGHCFINTGCFYRERNTFLGR